MIEDRSEKRPWRSVFWWACAIAFGLYVSCGRRAPVADKGGVDTSSAAAKSPREIEDALATQLQQSLQNGFDNKKQELFNAFHPIGTAKSVVVHDVTTGGWKHGAVTGRADDVLGFSARFTIYWEGPVVKDGFTKVNATWDNESQRWLPGQVVATNGITNDQAANLFIDIAATAAVEAFRNRGN